MHKVYEMYSKLDNFGKVLVLIILICTIILAVSLIISYYNSFTFSEIDTMATLLCRDYMQAEDYISKNKLAKDIKYFYDNFDMTKVNNYNLMIIKKVVNTF